MRPHTAHFYEVIDQTWPAAAVTGSGPFRIREGQGGGKRVSAATLALDADMRMAVTDIANAETAMRALEQTPLFMIRDGDDSLDESLAARGYEIIDPVNIYATDLEYMTRIAPPRAITWTIWEPLKIMHDIWAEGGIGPGRLDVMTRATCCKTALLGRHDNDVAATGFVGVHAGTAMVHALEVRAALRRKNMGAHMMRTAAQWAVAQGGQRISAVCTQANTGACALYSSLGMSLVGQYHYRQPPEGPQNEPTKQPHRA